MITISIITYIILISWLAWYLENKTIIKKLKTVMEIVIGEKVNMSCLSYDKEGFDELSEAIGGELDRWIKKGYIKPKE